MQQRLSIDATIYWGVFLFAAITIGYVLTTLINLSVQEETAFLASSNYRQQVRYVTAWTPAGSFQVALMRSRAPLTTRTFVRLADSGFYDKTRFYHFSGGIFVESGLIPTPPLTKVQGPGQIFEESVESLKVTRGFVAMPKLGNSKIDAGGLIFFTEDDLPIAHEGYAVFGRVIEGMDVVDEINRVSPQVDDGVAAKVSLDTIVID